VVNILVSAANNHTMARDKGTKTTSTFKPAPHCNLPTAEPAVDEAPAGDKLVNLFKHDRYVQILTVLTLIGGFLRFYNLGFNSIWLDEAATLSFARQSLSQIWEITATGEFNPPLFNWIEHLMLMFGNSEVVLRFIPALVGTLSIPFIYLLGKEAVNRNTGIIAAAFLAFSIFHIGYSQDARAYTLMLFFLLIAAWFAFRGIKNGKVIDFLGFGLFSALAVYTHFYAYVMVGILVIWSFVVLIIRHRQNLRMMVPWLYGVIFFVIVSLPMIILTVNLFMIRTSKAVTYGFQGIPMIAETLMQFSGSEMYFAVILIFLVIAGAVTMWKHEKPTLLFIAMAVILTFVLSYLLSFRMPMIPRYLIFLLPVFFIAAASVWRYLCPILKDGKAVYAMLAVALLISVPAIGAYYSQFQKEDWRGFAQGFSSMTGNGDVVVVLPGYISMPFDYYYSNATDGTIELQATTRVELERIAAGYPGHHIYYVLTDDLMAADPGGESVNWLGDHAENIVSHTGIYLLGNRT
jgi:mannosyltransferase